MSPEQPQVACDRSWRAWTLGPHVPGTEMIGRMILGTGMRSDGDSTWVGGVEINGTVFAGRGWDSDDKLAKSGRGPTSGYSLTPNRRRQGPGTREACPGSHRPETIEDQPHDGY